MRCFVVFILSVFLFVSVCFAVETTEAATTIVVDVDLSSLNDSISNLSSDISSLKDAVESIADVQESLQVEANDLLSHQNTANDSTAIAILIFIGIILSFSITLWLFRK